MFPSSFIELPSSVPPWLLSAFLPVFLPASFVNLPLSFHSHLSYLTSLPLFLPSCFIERSPSYFPLHLPSFPHFPPSLFLPARLILPPSSLPTFLYQTSPPFSYLPLATHPPNFRSSSLPHLSHASQAVCEDYNHFRTITSGSELIRTLSEKFKSCNLNRPLRDL